MKHVLYFLLSFSPLLAYGATPAPDCPKDADACSSTGPRSAFLAAAAKPAPIKAKHGKADRKTASLSAGVETSTTVAAAVAEAASAAAAAAERPAANSNPLWVLFAAGGLAGLYLYLKKDAAKKKRK